MSERTGVRYEGRLHWVPQVDGADLMVDVGDWWPVPAWGFTRRWALRMARRAVRREERIERLNGGG